MPFEILVRSGVTHGAQGGQPQIVAAATADRPAYAVAPGLENAAPGLRRIAQFRPHAIQAREPGLTDGGELFVVKFDGPWLPLFDDGVMIVDNSPYFDAGLTFVQRGAPVVILERGGTVPGDLPVPIEHFGQLGRSRDVRCSQHFDPALKSEGLHVDCVCERFLHGHVVVLAQNLDGAGAALVDPAVPRRAVIRAGKEIVNLRIQRKRRIGNHGVGRDIAVLHVSCRGIEHLEMVLGGMESLPFGGRGIAVHRK